MARLLSLLALIAACEALHLPCVPRASSVQQSGRAAPSLFQMAEDDAPATPEEAVQESSPSTMDAERQAYYDQMADRTFLGLDTSQPQGALIASLIVSVGFCVVVEVVKFLDPNTASGSVFGSIKTIGLE